MTYKSALFGLLSTVIVAALIFCGPASARPEISISNVDKQAVEDEIINFMIDRGYSPGKDGRNTLIFERPTDNVFATLLFGSRYDAQPYYRVQFTVFSAYGSIRIVTDLMIVSNRGSAFEQITPLDDKRSNSDFQTYLGEMKRRLEIEASANTTSKISPPEGIAEATNGEQNKPKVIELGSVDEVDSQRG